MMSNPGVDHVHRRRRAAGVGRGARRDGGRAGPDPLNEVAEAALVDRHLDVECRLARRCCVRREQHGGRVRAHQMHGQRPGPGIGRLQAAAPLILQARHPTAPSPGPGVNMVISGAVTVTGTESGAPGRSRSPGSTPTPYQAPRRADRIPHRRPPRCSASAPARPGSSHRPAARWWRWSRAAPRTRCCCGSWRSPRCPRPGCSAPPTSAVFAAFGTPTRTRNGSFAERLVVAPAGPRMSNPGVATVTVGDVPLRVGRRARGDGRRAGSDPLNEVAEAALRDRHLDVERRLTRRRCVRRKQHGRGVRAHQMHRQRTWSGVGDLQAAASLVLQAHAQPPRPLRRGEHR